ncbi:hypothetical protein JZ751_015658 [Albula glossodonta]|uniref:Uncharacterized protein n=1 Tax=Albula glossodonta TaxID=121402 RepID=A0A8T2NZF8_9TELE|nr:hypothetical protein JZ751_015658 [Albula glossodonta]
MKFKEILRKYGLKDFIRLHAASGFKCASLGSSMPLCTHRASVAVGFAGDLGKEDEGMGERREVFQGSGGVADCMTVQRRLRHTALNPTNPTNGDSGDGIIPAPLPGSKPTVQ